MGCTLSTVGKNFTTSRGDTTRAPCYSALTLTHAHASRKGTHASSHASRPAHRLPNQDRLVTVDCLLGAQEDVSLFGVFDGHGERGHDCSAFASQALTRCLQEELKEGGQASDDQVKQALHMAFLRVSKELDEVDWDTNYCGTTAVVALVMGRRVFIAHTGDSRAVLGTMMDNHHDAVVTSPASDVANTVAGPKMVTQELTSDHRPTRPDERARVLKAGAIILSSAQRDQIRDNAVPLPLQDPAIALVNDPLNPLRLWDRSLIKPGSCFTRSLGDGCAQGVGVIAEPEVNIMVVPESCPDIALVLASDGVFDGRSSEQVMEQVAALYSRGPLEVCKDLVSTGQDHDDRTAVCIFIQPPKPK